MITKETNYSYQDLTIVPAIISNINSRKDVFPYYKGNELAKEMLDKFDLDYDKSAKYFLPIFAAPMGCVVDENNFDYFLSNGIKGIIPTTSDILIRKIYFCNNYWAAFSINETKEHILNQLSNLCNSNKQYRLCIDCANGHMMSLLNLCKQLKDEAKNNNVNLEIMTGNIANPYVIEEYCKIGIDYVRVGIGGGSECITATQTGVFYPLASLMYKCSQYADIYNEKYNSNLKIIADGGIKNYSDVCKALALGADYVMIGGLFMQCLEAAADIYEYNWVDDDYERAINIDIIKCSNNENEKRNLLSTAIKYKHLAYGMSSKLAQQKRGFETLKTSEGKENFVDIKYTLKQWVENMDSYLRSAMSYTDSRNLEKFVNGSVQMVVNSPTVQNTINH